ncbi:AP-4 complex accessory subunit RUSC2 isoform X2 [Poeciliopsis prolifica]|uniref:AP-4 complex accessory subunit RUSC2 isoform X2 n=1 Tax=Poeciliopsis prolifica TaxID=188132 RepID=UPI0024136928|nr:AP-4 complex accessory subunit RUSC2 isoform X2 [Poeciliopsis prolifica]
MDSPPKVSGETLIVHHIPLVHCQVSGGCGGSLKRTNPFSPPESLGLSRTTSLPERDVLQREALLYSSLIQTSSGSWSSSVGKEKRRGGGRGGSTASDDSSFTSSNSEDLLITAHTLPRAKPRNRNPLRRNPFLLNTNEDEDEEDEEDSDNLHGYLEDSSFHLHSETNAALDDAMAPFLGFASEPFLLHSSGTGSSRESLRAASSDLSNHLDDLDVLGLDRERRHGSSGSNMSMDCGEHDWVDDDEEEDDDQPMRCGESSKTGSYSSGLSNQHCSCCALSQNFQDTFPEPFPDFQQGYCSDSSCNSSEGVLVNFSAIYNKMNNGIPEKQPPATGTSSVPNFHGNQQDAEGGEAFYLDLHTSPTEPPPSCFAKAFPLIREPRLSSSSACSCSMEHQATLDLDANCNSFHPPHAAGSSGDLASCLQSQARLVVATQNYYKLVTCDLSSQSSPSPAGSSVNSCSSEHSKGSPTPTQPSEYFLFRQRGEEQGLEEEEEDEDGGSSRRDDDDDDKDDEEKKKKNGGQQVAEAAGVAPSVIEGQVYVNISPPMAQRSVIGGSGAPSGGRPRSRSYDRNLDRCPSPRLGSLERMLSCPMRLSDGAAQAATPPPPPPRVTSFAEIARSKRRHGGAGGSPSTKAAADPFSSTYSTHSHSSVDFSPILEQRVESVSPAVSPVRFTRCYSQGSIERQLEGAKESQAKAEGVLSSSSESPPAVVRYSKDQRPTTLPIQPFTFHHQFTSKPPQPKPLLPLLTGYVSGMQARPCSGSGSGSGGPVGEESEEAAEIGPGYQSSRSATAPPTETVRPSPLGSYSPVRLQGAPSSGSCSTCTPSPKPAHSRSCPLSAGLGSLHTPPAGRQGNGSALLAHTPPPPSLGVKRGVVPPTLPAVQGQCLHHNGPALHTDTLSPLGCLDSGKLSDRGKGSGSRAQNAGQSAKLQQSYSDFLPDYFSLTEKPPEEFCLSPDASTSSSCYSSQSHVSVDLTQKRGLVKAVNTAVDLIVAHFGTSRDPDVKAKLGNSCVSPNVGHLILKYLCPALRDLLQDGLKAYVLDLIIGQRRCQPWSVVEASTQLGPSTRVLHSLFSKVSQFSELTSHSMRLNAFVFGLLNMKSLEFWFNHLYTHEDIIEAHYSPWGFLPLSQGPCKSLFEELLLLLQPLSLLPFDLDLLFEPHLLQKGQEQLRRKEQLRSAGPSSRSTFQLMRGWSTTVGDVARSERPGLRREGTWPGMERDGAAAAANLWKERAKDVKERDRRKERDPGDKQAGWWYQLMQSSQVYIDQSAEGSKFVKAEKRKKSSERRQNHPPPAREGVVEGAESEGERGASGGESVGRLSWMGSPPESVLNREKDPNTAENTGAEIREESPSQGQSLRWGRLFGSTVGSPQRAESAELRARTQKTRAPSGWLSLDRSILDLVAVTIGGGGGKKAEPPTTPTHGQTTAPPPPTETKQSSSCEVRALCHHLATDPGQLSFNKGDVLRVLRKADPDWLLCSLGSTRGLVPIIYVTLSSMEDSHRETGLSQL